MRHRDRVAARVRVPPLDIHQPASHDINFCIAPPTSECRRTQRIKLRLGISIPVLQGFPQALSVGEVQPKQIGNT
jgi:hypothetical protein